MTRFISVASGKGGVGKTTTALNLATALSTLGKKTMLVDANVTTPNVSLHLGFHTYSPTLQHVMNGKSTIAQALYVHPSGLQVMPSSLHAATTTNFHDGLHQVFLRLYGKKEFVIVDTAAGLGHEALSAMRACDEVLVVTNPNILALTDAIKTIATAKKIGKNFLGVAVNRYANDPPASAIKKIVNKPIISFIPEDKNIQKSLLLRHPVVHTHPSSKSSKEFFTLAQLLN